MATTTPHLTERQVTDFRTNGFVNVDDVLAPTEVADFRAQLEEAAGRAGEAYLYRENPQYTQHVNVWTTHAGVRRHVFDRRLAEIALRLTGAPRLRLWHDQLIVKMPGNRPSSWHQDLPLWPMIDAGTITCWLALVDVPIEMGAMTYLPGSHRWGRFAARTLPSYVLNDLEGVRLLVGPERAALPAPRTIVLRAGSCAFHDSLTFHYAGPNTTDRPRHGFIINYMPDDVRFSGQKHPTTDPLALEVGQPIAGELFPIIAARDPAEVASF